MDTSFSQLLYRSIFAAHCKPTKKSNNVSSKIALFENLRFRAGACTSISKPVDVDPKPLKVSKNEDLFKAYTLFTNSSTNSEDNDDDSTALLNSSVKSECRRRKEINIFCSTPRDTQQSTPNLILSPTHSIFSSDAGIVDDCGSEINSIDSLTSKKKLKTKRNFISSSSSESSSCTLSQSQLIDDGKRVKQTAIKLNRQRKFLLENDKLIRKRYDKIKAKLLVFKEGKCDTETHNKCYNGDSNKKLAFIFKSKLTVKLQLINKLQNNTKKIIETMICDNSKNKKYQNEVIFSVKEVDNNRRTSEKLNFPIVEFVFDEKILMQSNLNLNEEHEKQQNELKLQLSPTSSITSSTSSSSAALDTRSASTSSLDTNEVALREKRPIHDHHPKTINLITNHSKQPEMQILKLTRTVDRSISEQPTRKENHNLNGWNRRSKLGNENEKELNFIFQRMYYRYKNSLPPSPISPTSKKVSIKELTRSISEHTNATTNIDTYRKNGRLCSDC